jgi:hypothetical protein
MDEILPFILQFGAWIRLFLFNVSAPSLTANSIRVHRLVTNGEDFCQAFFCLAIWVLAANIDFATY